MVYLGKADVLHAHESESAAIELRTVVTVFGIKVKLPFIVGLTPPADYAAFANAHDRVRWARDFGSDATIWRARSRSRAAGNRNA